MNSPSRIQVTIYLAAIFLAGGVSGGAIHSRFGRHAGAEPPSPRRIQTRLEHQLNLTPEQVQQIQPILKRMARDYKGAQVASLHKMSDIISKHYEEISPFLTPGQQAKLRRIEHEGKDRLNRACR
jgi:hypothetical protein